MKKKKIMSVIAIVIIALAVAACGGVKMDKDTVLLPHYDSISENGDYNHGLYYRNDLDTLAADPSVIYISEGEEKGWFYLYGTSDEIKTCGYQGWRSKDLNNWECVGVVMLPSADSWAQKSYWAPEVVYYKTPEEKAGGKPGKYYMFYSAENAVKTAERGESWKGLGIAVSDSPNGPFKEWTGVNADGRVVGTSDEPIDFTCSEAQGKISAVLQDGWDDLYVIDANPFIDDNGDIYLYFLAHYWTEHGAFDSSRIVGMKMKDIVTPDYSTAAYLTTYGKSSVSAEASDVAFDFENVNEAPFMIKHNDRYYLGYSTSRWFNRNYSVCLAVSDSPLSGFEKLGKNPILEIDTLLWDFMAGTGHHCMVEAEDELFIVYHALTEREIGGKSSKRAVAFDRAFFVYDEQLKMDTIHVNGPTYSVQPLPAAATGYHNIAGDAVVSAENLEKGQTVAGLTDGLFSVSEKQAELDVRFKKGKSVIKLEFTKPVKIRSILVYTGYDYYRRFSEIETLYFENSDGYVYDRNGASAKAAVIKDLKVNPKYMDAKYDDAEFMYSGASATAEFEELAVTSVSIVIDSKTPINVSDIFVNGKIE